MKRKTASAIICQNFKINQQTIFQDFKCSFKSSFTYFGRLYIGEEHVCFIANMFGILKKCIIEIQKIHKIQEPSNLTLLIQQKQKPYGFIEYNFSGFKTNHAFSLIKALWKKQKIQSQILNSNDDQQKFIVSEDGTEPSKDKLSEEGTVESSFFSPKAIQANKQRLCQFQLPCSVQQYYNFFLADNATVYSRKRHLQLRQAKDIITTAWHKSQQLDSEIKQISALIHVNGVPFLSYAHMNQVQKLKKNQEGELFMESVTEMEDVPYCNYFIVTTYLEILKDGDSKCKMCVDMNIVFNKSTYLKSKIISKTILDLKEEYNFWFNQVKNILEKMKKLQQAEIINKNFATSKVTRTSSNIQFQSNDVSIFEPIAATNDSRKLIFNQSQFKEEEQIKKLNRKIDNLTKLVVLLLFLIFVHLLMSLNLEINLFSYFFNKKSEMTSNSGFLNLNDSL